MNIILAIDYGIKRSGLAYCEDPLNIAMSIDTVKTHKLLPYLRNNSIKVIFKFNKVSVHYFVKIFNITVKSCNIFNSCI